MDQTFFPSYTERIKAIELLHQLSRNKRNEASNLNKKYHSIMECAIKLHESFPQLSVHTCKSRIYDAINYLNDNCSVTSDAWLLYYADMFMKLFEVCLVAHNYQEAGRCLQKSCEYRIKATANAIDPQRIKFKPQIVSPDIVLERMFIKEKGVLTSFKQALSLPYGILPRTLRTGSVL